MLSAPKPIFETYEAFIDQDFSFSEPALNCVKHFLDSFPEELEAGRGYMAVRTFLRAFSDNAQTFSSYRTQAERLFLWTLLVKKKPLHQLKRQDAQDYLDFCRNPSQDWGGGCPDSESKVVPVQFKNDEGGRNDFRVELHGPGLYNH